MIYQFIAFLAVKHPLIEFKITNTNSINSKIQAPNTKELNNFNFSSIDEKIFFNSFAFLQDHLLVCFLGFWSLLFDACYLEFSLSQLPHEWIRKSLAIKRKKITNKIRNTMMNESAMFQDSMMPDIFSAQG